MSILETFFFMFEADASGVKKGLTEASTLSDQLEKKLQGTDAATQKVGAAFLKLATEAGKAAAAFLAFSAIKQTITDTADHTNAVYLQARAMGVSTEALSTWQHAVVATGGSAEAATQSFSNLTAKFRELTAFGGQSFLLNQLGLKGADMQAALKDPTTALLKLSETFGHLSNQQQLYLGQKLGLDMGTITLLSKGREGLTQYLERMRSLGVVTAEQAQNAAAYKQQVAELGLVFETVRRELTSDFLPALTWLLSKFENMVLWFREHKTFSIAFFSAIGAILTGMYIPTVIRAAVATYALIAPYLAIAAVIAVVAGAFALLAEDVYAFLHGQDSLIGELSKKWPIIGEVVHAVADTVGILFNLIKDEAAALLSIITDGPVKAFQNFEDAVDHAVNLLEMRFPKAAGVIRIFGDIVKGVIGGLFNTFHDLGVILSTVNDLLWNMIKTVGKLTGPVFDWLMKKAGIDLSTDTKGNPTGNGEPSPTSGGLPKPGESKDQKARGAEIATKLEAMGWTKAQAAGIAGSFLQESGGDPNAVNKTSGAQGLGQWLGQRKKDFEAFTGKQLEGSSLDDQLAFFNHETGAHGKEKRAGDMLRAAQTPEEAARIHSQYYERPGAAEANNGRRMALAADIAAAQTQLAATNSPISAMTTASVSNSSANNSKNLSVKTGDIHVSSNATDGKSVADATAGALTHHMNSAIDAMDDGVAA